MKVLFICNQNQNRSKTAELFFKKHYETKSAGLYNEHPVTQAQLEWADMVVVMEDGQRTELSKRFPRHYLQKRIISLDIPDVYRKDQPELVQLLRQKAKLLV